MSSSNSSPKGGGRRSSAMQNTWVDEAKMIQETDQQLLHVRAYTAVQLSWIISHRPLPGAVI
jgi:hypothetical protein